MNKTQQKKLGAKPYSFQKLQDQYISTLQQLIMLLCQLLKPTSYKEQSLQQLETLTQQLKFHQKIQTEQQNSITNIIMHLDDVLRQHYGQSSKKFRSLQFPQVKGSILSSLATITQKQSQQNLLSNYIRKSHNTRKISNYSHVDNHSDGLRRDFQVNRQQTRRSLDNKKDDFKPLYSQLEKIKDKQFVPNSSRNPFFKAQQKKQPKKSKLAQYHISKFI